MSERLRFAWDGGEVSGLWDGAAARAPVLVLGHGAGAGMESPFMHDLAQDLCSAGLGVVRFNFPYMEAGRRSTGPQRVSEDCYRSVAEAVRERIGDAPLFLGGKSYGGRMASHIVAQGTPASGLVFCGYPLHPPGRTEQLRESHLYEIQAPMLFIQGTRDSFARRDLIEDVVARLPSATLEWIDGGGHSFDCRDRSASDVRRQVVEAITTFSRSVVSATA
ncbi:MAG: alpha/beta fold hydrolase [Actinomycetota bacterium]|nr:alpha/beta fold hydrolase [Actinomycetota bacterium]